MMRRLAFFGVMMLAPGACGDSTTVETDLCAGRIGDPSIPTSCVVVRGRVLDGAGAAVGSVNVAVDCFSSTSGCEATPGETDVDGTYRLMVHHLRDEGASSFIVVRAHHRSSDRRAVSDTTAVEFAAMGQAAPQYVLDLHLN